MLILIFITIIFLCSVLLTGSQSVHTFAFLLKKGQSAAARLAKLPMVHSVCTKLSVMYTDTKSSHPKLRSVCEGLESSVTTLLSPVIMKLEPHGGYWQYGHTVGMSPAV